MLIDDLAKIPIDLQPEIVRGPYAGDKSHFWKTVISKMEVDCSSIISTEPLVRCVDYGLLTRNYYKQDKSLADPELASRYLTSEIWLRKGVVESLRMVDHRLQDCGVRLIVMSGYRHPELQRLIVSTATQERGVDFAKAMFADPDVYSPHASGGAFDIELWDISKAALVPTKFPGHIDRAYLEENGDLAPEAITIRNNRRVIHNALASDAILASKDRFIPHPFEYWHYGRHERLSAFFEHQAQRPHSVYYEELRDLSGMTA